MSGNKRGEGGAKGHGGGAKGNSQNTRAGSFSGGASKVQNVKLVLLGDQGVGKSCIALRFVRGEFTEILEATIRPRRYEYLTQTVSVSNQSIKFDIWDTSGQSRLRGVSSECYRGAQAAVIVYDCTNARTFYKAKEWVKELQHQANSQIIMVLAGNKADMESDKRWAVPREEAQTFAGENNLVFTECSAKTGESVGDVFMAVAQTIARNGPASAEPDTKGVKLGKNDKKKKDCCTIL